MGLPLEHPRLTSTGVQVSKGAGIFLKNLTATVNRLSGERAECITEG